MSLTLKVHIVEQNVTKVIQFDNGTLVYDGCRIVREKITEANLGQAKDYGLFLPGDEHSGVWLEPGRELRYYLLKNQDVIEYRRKIRPLKVRMLDGMVKTLMVDDSQPVSQLMVVICTKIGIMNHDEYSLVREIEQDELENKPNFGTLTLGRRRGADKERDPKMETLKRKLKTDDEINWVDHSKTLREQGVDEHEVLLLRRKFFFSDGNIDSQDPIQLNLLYVQCRDAILDGTHPVTQDKACEFAGIQCQIQFGEFVEARHKPGFLDLKEFLPQSYVKVKNIEKKVFAQHRFYSELSEIDAKFNYVEKARSLKTYGVTFFLVKEKMKGRNKLVPRLLGITKDSVLRLDEKTKEILKTWPLTTVRRWAASPNIFTLDFGDYSDQYFPFQTTEGEQIAQLIAGYIDIILKKQRPVGHIGIEGDEGLALQEDNVVPMRPSIIQHWDGNKGQQASESSLAKPAIIRPGVNGPQNIKTGTMGGVQSVAVEGQIKEARHLSTAKQPKISQVSLSRPQQALHSTIDSGQTVITSCMEDLDARTQLPELGTDAASVRWKEVTLDSNKQTVTSQIAAMNAATAEVITLTSSVHDEVDHTAVGAAIHTITSNLPEVTKGVKMIAALMGEDTDSTSILDATKSLCSAFSDLLKAAEPERREPRQNLIGAATRVGDASKAVLTTIDEQPDQETQDKLLGHAKAVANTTAALILKAKAVASHSDDQDVQNRVINAATSCALATSQLVACAKVVAPTIDNPACKSQLIEAAKEVGRAVENIVQVCQQATQDPHLLRDLSKAAADVTEALNCLLDYIKTAGEHRSETVLHDVAVEHIITSSDRLVAARGDSIEMIRQANVLSQASTDLITSIEREASTVHDSDLQSRLYAAAKVLADATSKMVETAKLCGDKPHDLTRQEMLVSAADNVRIAAYVAAGSSLRKKVVKRLENAAKHAAATATQCMAAAQGAGNYNTSPSSQDDLISDCKSVADVIPQLVEGVKGTINHPDSPRSQLHLINSCNQFLQPATKMVASVKAALPTVNDQASSMQLNNSSKQFSQALADLRTAMGKAQEACGSLEIESALDSIHSLDEELLNLKNSAWDGTLRPLPGETAESAAHYFANSSKSVGSNMAQLLTSASQGNEHYTGISSRDTAQALREFSSSVRMVVATSHDAALRERLIDAAREVMIKSMELIEESRIVVQNPQGAVSQQKLAQVAKGVSQALSRASSCLPGQKDVDDAIKNISDYTHNLESGQFPLSSQPYGELQSELTNVAAQLNYSSSDVVQSARQSTQQLGSSSKKFSDAFGNLMGVGMGMAGTTKDQSVRGKIVISLKSVSMTSSKLLVSAKSAAADPNGPNAKNALQSAARAVTDSINNLIDVCTSSAPGQKECENAIRAIQSMRPLLDRPSEAVTDASYFECLETVMDRSKSLGDGMTGIANHAKKLEHDRFGFAVKDVSEAICGLVESAGQAAYLVAVSDRSSSAGRPGLVDQSQFARAYQAICTACQTLNSPNSNQQQVLSAATIIAKHTSALCNSCRVASAKTNNPVAKKHFVQSAKDVANATAHLVKEIKVLDQDYSDVNRNRCGSATQPLLEAVENLCAFANSPEFASVPAKISTQARHAQEPITASGKLIIEGSCAMIEAAKSLAVNPKDPPTWQALANHSKNVSDSIKNLVSSIRDKAPGQRECEDAVDTLNINIRDLDQASLDAIDQNLALQRENNLLGFNEQVEAASSALYGCIDKVRMSGKSEAENLGHTVSQMATYFTPLVSASIGCSSNMTTSKRQLTVLDQTKAVLECALQLLYAVKEAGGNSKAVHVHQEIDESADSMKDALHDLLATEESIATEAGAVSGLVESITSAMNSSYTSTKTVTTCRSDAFVDYQTSMVASAKELTRLAKEMVAKSTSDPNQLGNLAGGVSREYIKVSSESSGAMRLASSPEMSRCIQSSVADLGQTCIKLVNCGGACQGCPRDTYCQKDLAESARHVAERVTHLLATLKESSQGTQACINAASTVSGIIGDLDTTIMFATAGTLNAENENETFSDHRDNILKTARALVEDTKALVSGAASSQEQLAVAAHGAVSTIVKLAEVVKCGAASLSSNNQESQVMLVNAVKDVAHALGDLIKATKSASGKSAHDPAIINLKESAKVMVTNVTSLLKTVKNVEDEQMQGIQALEATIEAIAQELRAYNSEDAPKTQATPEDLVRATKPITVASAKAVGVGMSLKQHDVVAASNMGRKAIFDMLTTCKAAAWKAETKSLRQKVMGGGYDAAVQYRELLQVVLFCLHKQSPDAKNSLSTVSRKIAHCLTDIVSHAEMLKGDDWVDPEDPSYIAENELLGAANSIEVAARKLQSLRPRQETTKSIDEDMNFEDIILEACKSIAAATGALVKAASKAQRELVDAGKIRSRPKAGSDDGQWSEGLISAARLVAASTHSLCEAANALVQGHSSEEKLIASAKQVAGSTAQLLVACKVKADPNSEATKRLQEAGNKVKRATDNLVKAAQQALDENEEKVLVWNSRKVPGLIQEIDSRARILKKRNELLKAEEEYRQLMKVKANLSGQSDTEGNMSGYDSAHEAPPTGKVYTPASFLKNSSNQSQDSSFNSSFGQSYLKRSQYSNQYPSQTDSNQSADEKPTHEIVDGPSFREAMNKFKTQKLAPQDPTNDSYRTPSKTDSSAFYETSYRSPDSSAFYETTDNVSGNNYERSYKMTTTSRSYHVQDS